MYKNHNSLVTYHDYAMLAYLNNNFDKSIELISKLMEIAEEKGKLEELEAAVYHDLGTICIEAMAYDKAIQFLNKAIKQDPQNKQAHFDRAIAYFETGKGIIQMEFSELENLIKEKVGTGQRVIGEWGQAGYKERVDFEKIIGHYAKRIEGQPTQYFPTSKGIIIYAKDGTVHVVPSEPKGIIK